MSIGPGIAPAQETRPGRTRYDMDRATVYFETGPLSAEEMERFSRLVDRGIADIETYLNGGVVAPHPETGKITYYVTSRVRMSRAFRRTILLPLDRVKKDSAPYLHETTHILLPARSECLWLSEGFASFVQSYVSENLGGYDGQVFSRGGNKNVDRLAKRYLGSERGQAVLPYVGGEGAPPEIDSERREVAAPFYVLSHSFLKFLVENAGLEKVKKLLEASEVPTALEQTTGRTASQWKVDWLAAVDRASDGRQGRLGGSP